jgi:hypothetical protein
LLLLLALLLQLLALLLLAAAAGAAAQAAFDHVHRRQTNLLADRHVPEGQAGTPFSEEVRYLPSSVMIGLPS